MFVMQREEAFTWRVHHFVCRFPPTRNRLARVLCLWSESVPPGPVASEGFFLGINGVLWSARETEQYNDSLIVKKCIGCLGESRARAGVWMLMSFQGVLVEKLHSRPHATMSRVRKHSRGYSFGSLFTYSVFPGRSYFLRLWTSVHRK